MRRYHQQIDFSEELQDRQLALLDRQEMVLRRVERLLERWEERAGIGMEPDSGATLDPNTAIQAQRPGNKL